MPPLPDYIDEPPTRVTAVLGLRRDHARTLQREARGADVTLSDVLERLLDRAIPEGERGAGSSEACTGESG